MLFDLEREIVIEILAHDVLVTHHGWHYRHWTVLKTVSTMNPVVHDLHLKLEGGHKRGVLRCDRLACNGTTPVIRWG
jgi:hypothetical protein